MLVLPHPSQIKINAPAVPTSTSTVSDAAPARCDADTADGEFVIDTLHDVMTSNVSFLNHNDPFATHTCYGSPTMELPVSDAPRKTIDDSFAVSTFLLFKTGGVFKELLCPFWLIALGIIFFFYSIVRLCQDLRKTFTEEMLYAVLAKYSAARDAASTVQGPTWGARILGSDSSEDTILCNDDEKPSGVPERYLRLYQIDFLCKVLLLEDLTFGPKTNALPCGSRLN